MTVSVLVSAGVSIPGPVTVSTVPPLGTIPGTIIVVTPGTYVTTTGVFTGSDSIASPTTITIQPTGTVPGTVIVQVPATTVTITVPYSGTASLAGPTTVTVTQTATDPGTIIIQTPLARLSCDVSGYLIQRNSLYGVDIASGAASLIKMGVGDGRQIQAMGYNKADNYLYATAQNGTGSTTNLVRIAANGDSVIGGELPTPSGVLYNVGDVDEQSQYWASNGGAKWIKVDLLPGSPTYLQAVASGTTALTPFNIADWAYVPSGGDYLWGLASDLTLTATLLVRFSRATRQWETVRSFGSVAGAQTWGAVYASADGFLYGSENASGQIWRFPLAGGLFPPPAEKISNGPVSSSNDGARCIDSTNPV